MMQYNELVSAQAGALVSHADRLRLAAAAYLARFKGTSRDHANSDLRGLYRFKNAASNLDLRVYGVAHAARWYSLITPPSTLRRCTGAASGTTTGSS